MQKIFIFAIFFIFFYYQPVLSQTVRLNVPINTQDSWETCWAAVSLSILQYYGKTNNTKWTIRYWANGGVDGVVCLYQATGCTGQAVDQILSHFGNITTSHFDNALSFDSTKSLLINDKPIIIRWNYPSSGAGHFLIITGYSGNGIYYMDPIYNIIKFQGYDWMVDNGGDHAWSHTLRIDTAPPFSSIVGNLGTIGRALPVITIINSLLLKPKH